MSRSDQADAAMLALPVVLVALTISVARWANGAHSTGLPFASQLTDGARRALVGLPRQAQWVIPLNPRGEALRPVAVAIPTTVAVAPAADIVGGVPALHEEAAVAMPLATPLALASAPARPAVMGTALQTVVAAAPPPQEIATLDPPADPAVPAGLEMRQTVLLPTGQAPDGIPPRSGPVDVIAARTPPPGTLALGDGETQCRATVEAPRMPAVARNWTGWDAEAFGVALARAARDQLDDFVIYNDRYTRIAYPMGDVHPMYGVCTDVVIRAYRALGIDLQALVQNTKSGSGDANIDHRRVDTLRKFFTRFGEVVPISTFAEDYRPGDIVTYWRPQNRHSRTHIAVVSDVSGPSGRPLIIHNRGWGPQQEDGLFVDKITGHFRFKGLKAAPAAAAAVGTTAPRKRLSRTGEAADASVIRTGLSVVTGEGVAPPAKPRSQP